MCFWWQNLFSFIIDSRRELQSQNGEHDLFIHLRNIINQVTLCSFVFLHRFHSRKHFHLWRILSWAIWRCKSNDSKESFHPQNVIQLCTQVGRSLLSALFASTLKTLTHQKWFSRSHKTIFSVRFKSKFWLKCSFPSFVVVESQV